MLLELLCLKFFTLHLSSVRIRVSLPTTRLLRHYARSIMALCARLRLLINLCLLGSLMRIKIRVLSLSISKLLLLILLCLITGVFTYMPTMAGLMGSSSMHVGLHGHLRQNLAVWLMSSPLCRLSPHD